MEQKYLIDTNVLIDVQCGRFPQKAMEVLAKIIDRDFTVSFITYIEYLGYKDIAKSSEKLIALATVVETNKTIIDICIELRKNYKIKLPDAIIASTAIEKNLSLLTSNEKDFLQIQNLKVINPYSFA